MRPIQIRNLIMAIFMMSLGSLTAQATTWAECHLDSPKANGGGYYSGTFVLDDKAAPELEGNFRLFVEHRFRVSYDFVATYSGTCETSVAGPHAFDATNNQFQSQRYSKAVGFVQFLHVQEFQ
jgi:hypothetical protein